MTALLPSVSTTDASVPNSTSAIAVVADRDVLDLADLDSGDADEVAVLQPRDRC